jgi:hypothetical protein
MGTDAFSVPDTARLYCPYAPPVSSFLDRTGARSAAVMSSPLRRGVSVPAAGVSPLPGVSWVVSSPLASASRVGNE